MATSGFFVAASMTLAGRIAVLAIGAGAISPGDVESGCDATDGICECVLHPDAISTPTTAKTATAEREMFMKAISSSQGDLNPSRSRLRGATSLLLCSVKKRRSNRFLTWAIAISLAAHAVFIFWAQDLNLGHADPAPPPDVIRLDQPKR